MSTLAIAGIVIWIVAGILVARGLSNARDPHGLAWGAVFGTPVLVAMLFLAALDVFILSPLEKRSPPWAKEREG